LIAQRDPRTFEVHMSELVKSKLSARAARSACIFALSILLTACHFGPTESAPARQNWISPGGDDGKTHHSALTGINSENVDRLGLAWEAKLGTFRGMEATPVVVDEVMYAAGRAGNVYALDAATGKELWRFEPEVDMQLNRTACCDMVNRGVAVTNGMVFVASLDGWLYALDAKTGKVAWKTDFIEDRKRGDTSTGAPEIAGDVVVIGMAGSEYDVRGYVTAMDLKSGKIRWRFHVVPSDPKLGPQESPELEAALKTWDPKSRWDIGGGGAPWDAMNFDKETGLLFVGTGNGGPYAQSHRSPHGGTNLYLSSIVALDPRTGKLKWHYQETPGDSWDFTATAPMILTALEIDGERRPVILHAPKNGFLYILDRRSGQLLRANPIVRTNWAKRIDLRTGRPELNPRDSDYSTGPKIIFPGSPGARSWHPGSYDPVTKLYYASVLDMGNLMFKEPGGHAHKRRGLNVGSSVIFTSQLQAALPTLPPSMIAQIKGLPSFDDALARPGKAQIRAIDPLTGKTVWARDSEGWQDRNGVLTTASGLLVHGTLAGQLRILDSRTGKLLKSIETGSAIMAAPMTYSVDGMQYVAVMAAWGGGGYPYVPPYSASYRRENEARILVFKVGGGITPLPPLLPRPEVAPPAPKLTFRVTPAVLAKGQALFSGNCAICHANQLRSGTPDLRRMQPGTHEAFKEIVLNGALVPAGMPRWDDILSPADADAIHAYLVDLQGKTRSAELARQKAGEPLDSATQSILSSF
jgi:quinohemoprotein ethanol dehydrogenase